MKHSTYLSKAVLLAKAIRMWAKHKMKAMHFRPVEILPNRICVGFFLLGRLATRHPCNKQGNESVSVLSQWPWTDLILIDLAVPRHLFKVLWPVLCKQGLNEFLPANNLSTRCWPPKKRSKHKSSLFRREIDAFSIKTTATAAYSTQAPVFCQTVANKDAGLILC